MRLRYLLTATLLLIISTSFGQIEFKKISYTQALHLAKVEKKLILLQIESDNCLQCNEVAAQGLQSKTIQLLTDEKFICLKTNKIPDELYNGNSPFSFSDSFFGTLFLNEEGSILNIMKLTTSQSSTYEDAIANTINVNKHQGVSIKYLDSIYRQNNNFVNLLNLVRIINNFALEVKQPLIDSLVELAPQDSAKSISFLSLIAECAPDVYSQSYIYIRNDYPVFNEMWYNIPLKTRIQINDRAIAKSLSKAIKEKNIDYAKKVAFFSKSINTNTNEGEKNANKNLLDYFYSVKDTIQYKNAAIAFYNKYFMSINVDSIKRLDNKKKENLDMIAKRNTTKGAPMELRSYTFLPEAEYYGKQLNRGAWNLYMFSSNKSELQLALKWAQNAVAFYQDPDIFDTYARLLYKIGKKETAMKWEAKAVESAGLANRNKTKSEYSDVLKRMALNEENINTY
ncbi:hypothetical protein [Rhizosphaericola mali]|uniref:DUF255 domain-containing protein n=1 Tax=Rhizosphaericola mali TaxID=2545455 RepID=A0A5P2FXW0_9BACT|nr:hypothetical protein [Rhizosphaericola mali]QES87777.1 hypothetical protein E0W69_003540 [Rhizosphaericola mali]